MMTPHNINTTSLTPLAFTIPPFSASSPPELFLTSLFPHLTRLFFSPARLFLPILLSLSFPLFSPLSPFSSPSSPFPLPVIPLLSWFPSLRFPHLSQPLEAIFWDLEGWILQGLMPLWIYPLRSLFQQLSSASSFTPLHISCLIQSGPLWPKHVIPLGDSDERGSQNPYRKSSPTDLLLLATRLGRCQSPLSPGTLFFRLLTDLCIKLLIFFSAK